MIYRKVFEDPGRGQAWFSRILMFKWVNSLKISHYIYALRPKKQVTGSATCQGWGANQNGQKETSTKGHCLKTEAGGIGLEEALKYNMDNSTKLRHFGFAFSRARGPAVMVENKFSDYLHQSFATKPAQSPPRADVWG